MKFGNGSRKSRQSQSSVKPYFRKMNAIQIILLILLIADIIPFLSVIVTYVIIPHKSLKEGLTEWWHESDEDI